MDIAEKKQIAEGFYHLIETNNLPTDRRIYVDTSVTGIPERVIGGFAEDDEYVNKALHLKKYQNLIEAFRDQQQNIKTVPEILEEISQRLDTHYSDYKYHKDKNKKAKRDKTRKKSSLEAGLAFERLNKSLHSTLKRLYTLLQNGAADPSQIYQDQKTVESLVDTHNRGISPSLTPLSEPDKALVTAAALAGNRTALFTGDFAMIQVYEGLVKDLRLQDCLVLNSITRTTRPL